MRSIPVAFQTMLDSGRQTLAFCWSIARTDGTTQRFTDFEDDLIVSSNTYSSVTGFKRTAITFSEGLQTDNLDVTGFLSVNSIQQADVLAGVYDYAAITVSLVNYADTSQGLIPLVVGRIGDVSIKRNEFSADLNGLTQQLQQMFGEVTSAACRAVLGDARCGKNLSAMNTTGTVSSVTNSGLFVATIGTSQPAGWWDGGEITWTLGNNAGRKSEVKTATIGTTPTIQLHLPMLRAVQVGDTFTLSPGCDHSRTTCATKFSNGSRFVGEPDLPGLDKMLQRGDL